LPPNKIQGIKQKTNLFYPGANVPAEKKDGTEHEIRSYLDTGSGKIHIRAMRGRKGSEGDHTFTLCSAAISVVAI
jgi:hypothetical protein